MRPVLVPSVLFASAGLAVAWLATASPRAATQAEDRVQAQERAQEARSEVIGVVRDRSGKAVEGAQVRLWLSPSLDYVSLGVEDEVRATTDAAGRFRASLLMSFPYSAVATWTVDGQARQSEVHARCETSQLQRLTEPIAATAGPGAKLRLHVTRAQNEPDAGFVGSARLRVYSDGLNPLLLGEAPLDAELRATIAVPFVGRGGFVTALLYDDRGLLEKQIVKLSGDETPWDLRYVAAQRIRLRVVDENNTPVRDARIDSLYRDSTHWRNEGRVNEQGEASLRPSAEEAHKWTLRVRAPGKRDFYLCRRYDEINVDGKLAPAILEGGEIAPIIVSLSVARPLWQGRWTGRLVEGAPSRVVLRQRLGFQIEDSVTMLLQSAERVDILDQGLLRIAPSAATSGASLRVYLLPHEVAELRARFDEAANIDPLVTLWRQPALGLEAGDQNFELDVARLEVEAFTVLHASKNRAAGVALLDLDWTEAGWSEGSEPPLTNAPRTDKRGRIARVRNDSPTLFVLEGEGFARFAPSSAGKNAGRHEPLILEPFAKRRLRVVDHEGKAVPNATLFGWVTHTPADDQKSIEAVSLNHIGLSGRCDENGERELWWIQLAGMMLEMHVSHAGKTLRLLGPESSSEIWVVTLPK